MHTHAFQYLELLTVSILRPDRLTSVRFTTSSALNSLQEQSETTPPPPAAAAAQLTPSPPLERERNSPVSSEEDIQELSNHSEGAENSPRPPSTASGRETVFSSFSDVSIDISEDGENISRVNGIIPETHGDREEERVSVNGIDEPPQEMETEAVQPRVANVPEECLQTVIQPVLERVSLSCPFYSSCYIILPFLLVAGE